MSTSSLSLTPAFGHFTWLLVPTASKLSQLEFQAPAEASQASLLASVFLLFNLIFYFFLFFRQKIEHLKETTCVSQRMNTFSFLLGLEVTSFLINCSVIFSLSEYGRVHQALYCTAADCQGKHSTSPLSAVCHFFITIVLVKPHECALCYLASLG